MIRFFLYLIPLSLALFFGYTLGSGKSYPRSADKNILSASEEKRFAIVVHSYKNGALCERSLRSILEQRYENYRVFFFDDASFDGTLEKARSFILEKNQEEKVVLLHNEEHLGELQCLAKALAFLSGQEIIIPLNAKDWMAHPDVLQTLNAAYQNSDVWMTKGGSILYPSYERAPIDTHTAISAEIPISFYARLIDPSLDHSHLRPERKFYGALLQRLAKNHCTLLDSPLFFVNQGQWRACSDD